jgi:hypothetical protein
MLSLNPAFDLLRKYKPCEQHTEELVMKHIRGKISNTELITVVEKGVIGEFGKFVVADPQTIIGWITAYQKSKEKTENYLETSLIDPSTRILDLKYPSNAEAWFKEANKCFIAYINGVHQSNFHPHVYDRMMLDGKISLNAYLHFYKSSSDVEESVKRAKQEVLAAVFSDYRSRNWSTVYFIA